MVLFIVPVFGEYFINYRTVIANIGTLANVVIYQGLIIRLFLFFWFEALPEYEKSTGFFDNMDARDMLIFIDIVLFIAIFASLVLLLSSALFTDGQSMMCTPHLQIMF